MKLFISIIFLIFPMFSQAESLSDGSEFLIDERRILDDESSNQGSQGDSGGEDLGDTGGFHVTQQGALEGTNAGQSQGGGVQMLGMAMGAAFASICPQVGGQWACPLAAMSFMDAMSGGSAKQAAFQTGSYIDPSHGSTGENYNVVDDGNNDILQAQAADGLKNLSDLGYTTNSDGSVTGPDGQSYLASDYGSIEDLMAKGMTPVQAQNAIDKINSVKQASADKVGMNLAEAERTSAMAAAAKTPEPGSLNAYGSSSAPKAADKYINEVEYRNKKKKLGRLPASQAADLSKNYNGDPIGIGMANIFLIVHKKYKQKKSEKEFFNSEY